MTTKRIPIVHRPEQPEVYIVVHGNLQPNLIGNVFSNKNEALQDAAEDHGWVVLTRDLEIPDA